MVTDGGGGGGSRAIWVIFAPAGALITRSPVLADFDDDAEQVRTTLSNMRHMVESADSSLERVVRVHVVLADISNLAEWIACSANSSQSIRRRAPPGPCSCVSATATDRVRGAGRYSLGSVPISMAVRPNQFDLAPENLTTFRHFSVSSSMNVVEPAGELASTVAPKLASLATMPGSASAALISLLSA